MSFCCPHRGRELSEFVSAYRLFVCQSELTEFFAELTEFGEELSEFSLPKTALCRCPSTVRPVFPMLVSQLSKQQNRTRTTSSTVLETPPNRTRTKKNPLRKALRRFAFLVGLSAGNAPKIGTFTAWNRTRNRTRTPPEALLKRYSAHFLTKEDQKNPTLQESAASKKRTFKIALGSCGPHTEYKTLRMLKRNPKIHFGTETTDQSTKKIPKMAIFACFSYFGLYFFGSEVYFGVFFSGFEGFCILYGAALKITVFTEFSQSGRRKLTN